jgi:hypothetical protein
MPRKTSKDGFREFTYNHLLGREVSKSMLQTTIKGTKTQVSKVERGHPATEKVVHSLLPVRAAHSPGRL